MEFQEHFSWCKPVGGDLGSSMRQSTSLPQCCCRGGLVPFPRLSQTYAAQALLP